MSTQAPHWNEFKKNIAELVEQKISLFCRGQANEHWKLQTTFHRVATITGVTLPQYGNEIVPELHYLICAVQNEIIDLTNKKEFGAFLSLVQHHGFPTPLLDWTLSPYIAVYFAYREVDEKNPQSDNVRIYLFNHLEWEKVFPRPFDLRTTDIQYVSVLRPFAKYNPRIIPQQGAFTVTNVDDMEIYIYIRSREVETNKIFLFSITLPVKEKPWIMRELNLMGINEMTLFPSIDGICRAMKAQFFSLDKIGSTSSEKLTALQEYMRKQQRDMQTALPLGVAKPVYPPNKK